MNLSSAQRPSTLTEEQRAAAHAPHSVAVTAGAGTGKTHMLAERYLFHLTHLNFSPLNLVAVTFTNDAAAELRSRIRRQIANHFGPNSDAVAEVDAAQISTFHTLAARICREQADVLGIPADFKILEDFEGQLWYQEQFDFGLHELHQAHPEIYDIFGYTRLQSFLETLLKDPLKADQALRCPQETWLKALKELQEITVNELLETEAWQDAISVLETHQSVRPDKLEDCRNLVLQGQHDLLAGRYEEAIIAIKAIDTRYGAAKNWDSKETLGIVKDALKNLKKSFTSKSGSTKPVEILGLSPNELDRQQEHHRKHLQIAFDFMIGFLDQSKKTEKVLEFNDLERYALKALESPNILSYYQNRWRAFLVDEFQDTNSIQGRLLDLLTKNAILTIVGDDKQAIYGFRGGDVNVFRQWRDRITQAGQEKGQNAGISLTLSFRSHQKLVEKTNQIFKPILKNLHQDLQSNRPSPDDLTPIEFHYLDLDHHALPEGQATRKADLGQPLEANWLADTIQTLQAQSFQWRDMVVLGRTWKDLMVYERVLKRRKIPTYLAQSSNLLESREALDLIALLRFIADPRDNLALVSLLRSPFFAVGDRALYQVNQKIQRQRLGDSDPNNRSRTWWDQLSQDFPRLSTININGSLNVTSDQDNVPKSEDVPLGRAVAILKGLLKQRYQLYPTQILQLADQETGYTAAIANLNNAEQRLIHWQGFYELVRQLQGHSRNVFAVVRTLKALIAQAQKTPWTTSSHQTPTPPLEAGDVVILQTLHGSKGLEWPVVFLPDLTKDQKFRADSILMDEHLGLAWKSSGGSPLDELDLESEKNNDSSGTQSCHYVLLKILKARAEAEELKRLYYVGFTRARDRLYASSQTAQRANTALDFLRPALESAKVPTMVIDPNFDALESSLIQPEFAPPPLLKNLRFKPQIVGSGLTDIPVVGLGIYAQCPKWFEYQIIEQRPWQDLTDRNDWSSLNTEAVRNSSDPGKNDREEFPDPLNEWGELDNLAYLEATSITLGIESIGNSIQSQEARRVGLLTHLALEHRCRTVEMLKVKANQRRVGGNIMELETAIALAETFWETPLYRPFWQPFQEPGLEASIQREVPLTLELESLQLVGIADYVGPDFVLDFKTGDRHPEHDFQVWAYGKALGRDRAVLAYLNHKTLEELSSDRQNALAQEAQQLATGISRGEFAPKTDAQRCPTCPYLDLCEAGQAIASPPVG
jgi:ATP-dependent helicase/nuclease subunit A